jgi:hypothetical protein
MYFCQIEQTSVVLHFKLLGFLVGIDKPKGGVLGCWIVDVLWAGIKHTVVEKMLSSISTSRLKSKLDARRRTKSERRVSGCDAGRKHSKLLVLHRAV